MSEKNSRNGGGGKRGRQFLPLVWRGNLNFFILINYWENKVKLKNKDCNKNNVNEIKEII